MTAQTLDLKILEELLRKVVREEIRNVIQESAGTKEFADEEEFMAATRLVFNKHKKVFDALA